MIKRKTRRALSVLLALTVILAAVAAAPLTAYADGEITQTAACGDSASFTLYSDNVMVISGSGANSLKMIYTVKNKTASPVSFLLGSSGDIKIGLDDKATRPRFCV